MKIKNLNKEFRYKVYAPNKEEYDGVITTIYKGITDEEEPKAIFEIKMDFDYLTKNVITVGNESDEMITDILSDMADKQKEIEVRKEKEKENEIKKKAIMDFCDYIRARTILDGSHIGYYGYAEKFIKRMESCDEQ